MENSVEEVIYYKDNPNLGFATRVLKSGEREYRVNLKRILNEYYTINVDCFLVNGKWTRLALLVFDEEKKCWALKNDPRLVNGVVGIEKGGVPRLGYFSRNPYNNVQVYCSGFGQLPCLNVDILIENGFTEDFSTGVWYNEKNQTSIRKLQTPRNSVDHRGKGYNIEDNATEFELKKKLFEEFKPELSKDVRHYGRMLGDSTFGLELECAKGFLPENIQNRTGVVICRDGSLKDENGMCGPEFVTIPMGGAKMLQTINTLSKELSKRTTLDLNCSLHVHIGNIPTSRIFLVTLLKLCLRIQNDLFLMFPYYKTNPEGVKNKNYNQKLPTLSILSATTSDKENFDNYINNSYKKIFSWLAEGIQPDQKYNRKGMRHPINAKWDRTKRYFWMNLMNTIFSSRNTVEFRLHTPTTNAQKIINWVFICNAIVKYAINHSRQILTTKAPISINDILDHYKEKFPKKGEFLSEYLKAYIQERKDSFMKDYKAGDRVSKHEMEQDSEYSFKYQGISNLF